eukprot:364311-Chlamydomonas_euryale.AAC.11
MNARTSVWTGAGSWFRARSDAADAADSSASSFPLAASGLQLHGRKMGLACFSLHSQGGICDRLRSSIDSGR